jgi:hypothetical protein
MSRQTASACLALAACLALPPARAQFKPNPTPLPSSKPNQASLDDFQVHLRSLSAIVEACANTRDAKSCDPAAVGPDDEVPLSPAPNAARRLVRYGWLRVLLAKAQEKDAPPPKAETKPTTETSQAWENVRPITPSTTQLLKDAETRLTHDLAQANTAAAPQPDHNQERAVMNQVLSGHEYRNVTTTAPKDSAMEKVGNWLNNVVEGIRKASAHAPWLGGALIWGFILAVCIGLVWGLLQLERRWRVRLVPADLSPAPGAASAIHWQLWLEDARRAAAAGQWREAIHFLYWAAISRLESKRLWPADRARTPREYLALVATDDPRQPGLASLTGSFERVWYGGRNAAESDYHRAEQIATALISGATSPGSAGGAPQ